MRKLLFVLATFVLFGFCSCSKDAGDPITKDFEISGTYTKLDVSSGFVVTVSDSATQVSVTTGENVMPKVVVEIVNQTLRVYLKPVNVSGAYELQLTLPYNADLKSVNLSGASSFQSSHPLTGQKVEVDLSGASSFFCDLNSNLVDIDLSGASSIEGNVSATELDLDMSGASEASLVGTAISLRTEISGASHIINKMVEERFSLACRNCTGEISGASTVYIHCDESITVDLSGGSDLYYTGHADTSGSTTSGGSRIIRIIP